MEISKGGEEVSLPPDSLITDMIQGLDDAFREFLTTKATLSAPKFRKRDTGTHGLEHVEQPPMVDEDTRLLTKVHNNNPPVSFTTQEFNRLDVAMRKSLYPLSAISASNKAMSEAVKDKSDKTSQELHSVLEWQNRQIASLADFQQFVLGSLTLSRRHSLFKTMSCDSSFLNDLYRQPWSSHFIFNSQIKTVAKEVREFEGSTQTVELSSKSVKEIARSVKAFSKTRNFQPTRSCFRKGRNQPSKPAFKDNRGSRGQDNSRPNTGRGGRSSGNRGRR